jgi:anti-anti-sigma regulatory factor
LLVCGSSVTGWAACPPRPLVIDLTGFVFLSAAGLELLVPTEQQCRERQTELFDITPTLVAAIRPPMT